MFYISYDLFSYLKISESLNLTHVISYELRHLEIKILA